MTLKGCTEHEKCAPSMAAETNYRENIPHATGTEKDGT